MGSPARTTGSSIRLVIYHAWDVVVYDSSIWTDEDIAEVPLEGPGRYHVMPDGS